MEFIKTRKKGLERNNKRFLLFFVSLTVIFSFSVEIFAQSGRMSVADQVALVTEFEVNGLKVLYKRRPNAPTVAAGLFVRGGSRNITAKNSGIESFMLDVATEGSKKFPRDVLRRELSRTGSGLGASSNNDFSVLSLGSTLQNFDLSWEMFADAAINPLFDNADIELVRKRIISGLKEEETDNDNFLDVLRNRIVYAEHPYSNNVDGTLATINSFKKQDLRTYHKQIMKTSRLLLVIVGDLDVQNLKAKITKTLGKLPRGNYVESDFPKLNFSKGTVDVTQRSLPTNYVKGIYDAPSLNSSDYYPMRVATMILSTRIFREVRVKRQLTYAASASLESDAANTGHIYVTAVDANQAVSVMFNVIDSLKANPISQEEIDGMAGQFLTSYYIKQETNAAQALELAKYELIGGGWRNSFQLLNRLRAVKPQEVQAVAQKYIKNIRFVVVGNPSAVEKEIFLQQTD